MRKLNVHRLVRDLNNLCENLDNQYDVNCGGCCFVAYEIAKHLDRFNIEYSLCIANTYPLDKVAINKEVINKQSNKIGRYSVTGENSCNHYYIRIKGGGSINFGDFYDYHKYSINKINCKHIKWIYENSLWNDIYDIRYNKLIKRNINFYFNGIRKTQIRFCKNS